jgi:hypothetical protein
VTGVVPVGADDEATLFGGLGMDGKNASFVPFGKTVPFVGNVGDPEHKKTKKKIGFSENRPILDTTSCVMISFSRHHMAHRWT